MNLARAALRGMLRPDAEGGGLRSLTAERVRDVVADEWGVTPAGLESRRRTKDLTVPRQVAMYLIRDLLDLSLVKVGELFGGRDHSTVIHSVNKVEETMEEDPDYRRRVESLRDRLQRPA